MEQVKLVYGGYISFPLAPKDTKNVQKLLAEYSTPEDTVALLTYLSTERWGCKIEGNSDEKSWKAVVYNRVSLTDGDNHAYYISGESDTLLKCLVVVRYKIDVLPLNELSKWTSTKEKVEFR